MSRLAEFRKAESKAKDAEELIASSFGQNASLEATINAADLYMRSLRLADAPDDRTRVDLKCKALLSKAEKLKNAQDGHSPKRSASASQSAGRYKGPHVRPPESSRALSTREKIVILEGSKLNGCVFKPWEKSPIADEFKLQDGQALFEDQHELSLSPAQLLSFAGWKRPKDALAHIEIYNHGQILPNEPTMTRKGRIDLVQDLTSDCSVVASLCASTSRVDRGHPKILRTIVHPYDNEEERVMMSETGRYVLKLRFNGCWRRVEIDDKLPASTGARVLHVVDRTLPGLLWPALVEKAYLKVRGGYDFPGSNSGTDLAVMTGWIPQQVFLHDEDVDMQELWTKIYENFHNGDLLLTIGTGKLPRREQRLLGLAAEHDYAVLEMKECGNKKEMLIKNPWADGDVWNGTTSGQSHQSPGLPPTSEGGSQVEDVKLTPGTFWMELVDVFQYFENLYVNWNPILFSKREDLHFTWDLAKSITIPGLFLENPQFTLESTRGGEVWVLLNKHFRTSDRSRATQGGDGYIGLYVYEKHGRQVVSSDRAKIRGPYVDSPNTLVILHLIPGVVYTIVVASQGLRCEKYNFTLSVFSQVSVRLAEATKQLAVSTVVRSAWTRSTAGGNSDCINYLANPQFSLSISEETDFALVLNLERSQNGLLPDFHVKILILSSVGLRVTRLRPRDLVAHSGDYRRGSAVLETNLATGKYTIICSTFDPDQYGKICLTLHTARKSSAALKALATEDSGRLRIRSDTASFPVGRNRMLAPLTVFRSTRAIFIVQELQTVNFGAAKRSTSLFKMTLEQGQGPYKSIMASSEPQSGAEFTTLGRVRIEDTDLQPTHHAPGTAGLWLVLERFSQTHSSDGRNDADGTADELQVEVLTDERVELGVWGVGDG